MKTIILFSIFCVFTYKIHAQITTNDLPISFDSKISKMINNIQFKTLHAPNLAMIKMQDEENDKKPEPLRYAYPVEVNYTLTNSGEWQILDDGGKLWKLSVNIPGALSLSALYNKFWIPEGAKFFVYSKENKKYIGAITSEFLNGSSTNPKEFATGLIYGDNITFEYYQPSTVTDSAIISIFRIDYGYRFVKNSNDNMLQSFGDAAYCEININCSQGNNWQTEKYAAARVSVVGSEGSGWCSCALVNNTANDYTPYVLTANHCLGGLDAVSNSSAAYWTFYWDYEQSGCTNSSIEPAIKSTTGAIVVANNSISDFALLQLTQDPRNVNNFTPYYLGWDKGSNSVTSGVGIHHPKGDVKKISISSQIQNYSNSIGWDDGSTSQSNTHWKVIFSNGIIEKGSSGSPFINNNKKVIGQLHGGDITCINNPTDYYGKFSVSWKGAVTGNGATDNRRRLNYWLDPLGTNPNTLDGIAFAISGANALYSLQQATYSISNLPTGTTVTWSGSSNVNIISGQGTSQVTISICGGSTATLTAMLSGTINNVLSKNLTVNNGELTITLNGEYAQVHFDYPNAQCYDWIISYDIYSDVGNGSINCTNNSSLTVTPLNGAETGTIEVRAKINSCYSPWQSDIVVFWRPEIDGTCSYLNPSSGEPFYACLVAPFPETGKLGEVSYRWYIGSTFIGETYDTYIWSHEWPCGMGSVGVVVCIDNQETEMFANADFWGMCGGGGWGVSSAYPNPASSELIIDRIEETNNIETTAINTQSAKVKVSNITVLLYSHSTTQLVYNKTYSSSEKQIKIDTSKLPNGIYHLNIIENGEKIKEQTIVINH